MSSCITVHPLDMRLLASRVVASCAALLALVSGTHAQSGLRRRRLQVSIACVACENDDCSMQSCSQRLLSFQQQTTDVFINEFHYDNTGADENEFIEVAFPSGMRDDDVKQYWVILYNGKNGIDYRRFPLGDANTEVTFNPGFLDSSPNGLRFAHVKTDKFQNGGKHGDGIVLFDNKNNVTVQFLCYEGTNGEITSNPTRGKAIGESCSEVLVIRETSSASVNGSLSLVGTGCFYEDFTWELTDNATRGEPNNGQDITCSDVSMLDLHSIGCFGCACI